MMKKALAVAAVLGLLCLGGMAQADVFNLGPGLTNLEMVRVGDRGNDGELSGSGAGGYGPDRVCGSVGDNYRIGKYEVTAAQYCDFLNCRAKSDPFGLYNVFMETAASYGCSIKRGGSSGSYSYSVASDWANRPVNYISYWDACRFVNWLNNGQGDGDTETGAYTIPSGYNGDDGRDIQRNIGARWFLPSEDEWYKAAFYKGGGPNAGYWKYATQNNASPSNMLGNPDPGNNATYYAAGTGHPAYTVPSPYWRSAAGEHENSESAYGTYDQNGNVWEWNETVVCEYTDYIDRGVRGGSFMHHLDDLPASARNYCNPSWEDCNIGFRVASIPEPSAILALLGGLGAIVGFRRRRGVR
jgi:formylglycine-generating enzyme required for sulfatase activity